MNSKIVAQVNPNSTAYQFGRRDARDGQPCVPEMFFVQRVRQIEYATGYESVRGVTPTTAYFTRHQEKAA